MKVELYEYKTVKLDVPINLGFRGIDHKKLEDYINVLGEDGWALQTTSEISFGGTTRQIIFIFMREL